jgi:16S rRNA (guanine1207-N2)-methyltransferase
VDDNAVKTLFLPFDSGELLLPKPGDRWLFLNAAVPAAMQPEFRPVLACIQGFRPAFLALERAGYSAIAELDAGEDFAGSLVLLGKHRELNRSNIRAALARSRADAPVLVAGSKTSGIESMRKEMAALFPIVAVWSKHHAQVFQVTRPSHWVEPPHGNISYAEIDGFGFETAPGMFSHKAVDAGSALLARHLSVLKGRVADFGAGWGYLSWAALDSASGIESLHVYEADYASLRAAKTNLNKLSPTAAISFHWSDLVLEPPTEKFDFIMMNPPFHTGRQAEPDIGKRIIEVAAASLKPKGELLMVANKQLPYEDTLQRAFRRFERIDEDRLYKVVRATR